AKVLRHLVNLKNAVANLVSDIDLTKDIERLEKEADHAKFTNLPLSAKQAIGLARYYIEKHGDKIPPQEASRIRGLIYYLYCATFNAYCECISPDFPDFREEASARNLDANVYDGFADKMKPSVEEILAFHIQVLSEKGYKAEVKRLR